MLFQIRVSGGVGRCCCVFSISFVSFVFISLMSCFFFFFFFVIFFILFASLLGASQCSSYAKKKT